MRNLFFKNIDEGRIMHLRGRLISIKEGKLTYYHLKPKNVSEKELFKWLSDNQQKIITDRVLRDEGYLEGKSIQFVVLHDQNGWPFIQLKKLEDISFYSMVTY